MDRDGDINQDTNIDILDIVTMINIILSSDETATINTCLSDINHDGTISVFDVIQLINLILDTNIDQQTEDIF